MSELKQKKQQEKETMIKRENAALFRENGFEILGTLSFHQNFLIGTACYTLKRTPEGDGVYSGCVVRAHGQKPAITKLQKL